MTTDINGLPPTSPHGSDFEHHAPILGLASNPNATAAQQWHTHTSGATSPATQWMGVAVALFTGMQCSSQFTANGNTEHKEDCRTQLMSASLSEVLDHPHVGGSGAALDRQMAAISGRATGEERVRTF
jgi:hypothetical protein